MKEEREEKNKELTEYVSNPKNMNNCIDRKQ
jgi:hypothetical protein